MTHDSGSGGGCSHKYTTDFRLALTWPPVVTRDIPGHILQSASLAALPFVSCAFRLAAEPLARSGDG